jgi:hypothetical protein
MAEDEKTEEQKPQALQVAVIGLVGTVLTVCGGLTGAAVSGAATICEIERQVQQVALAPPGGAQTLTVDTRQIAISHEEAQGLDAGEYYVTPDPGFVLARPRTGWSQVEVMTYRDLFVERGAWTGSAWDEQPVHRIRYGEPVQVQYHEGTVENGVPVAVEALRSLLGSDTFQRSNEITVLSIDKRMAAHYTLASVALEWGMIHRGGVNRIVASEGSEYILMQSSWQLQKVRVDGQDADLSMERWALFAKGPEAYFVVEVNYLPQTGQPMQVWEDLQAYMHSFRVIR